MIHSRHDVFFAKYLANAEDNRPCHRYGFVHFLFLLTIFHT
jgi:hypothetical protein